MSLRLTSLRAILQAWATAPAPYVLPSRPDRYSSSSPSCNRSLRNLSGVFSGIRKPVVPDGPRGPVFALPVGAECFGDAGEKNAYRREPLLPINDAVDCHRLHCTGFWEREQSAAIMRRLGARRRLCHGQEVVNQPLNVGLIPAVPALPAGHYVLHL